MSVFSAIQSCPIETHCVIEGMAASMGSVIWAAGDKIFMHDYSLLMIHNPFVGDMEDLDESTQNMLKAFKGQLETIYEKRFGIDKAKVREIMDGKGEADGTYLSASDAVKTGILPKSNVITTCQQVRDDIKAKIKDVTNIACLRDVMASVADEASEHKLIAETLAILDKNTEKHNSHHIMNEKELSYDALCAQLGMKDVAVASVAPRINELLNAEKELETVKASLSEATIKLQGKEAEVTNLNAKLSEVEAALKSYKEAEAAAKAAEVENIVDQAVAEGKIGAEAKAQWVALAETNLEMVKATLASIPAREVITDTIANDPANVDAAIASQKTTEKELAAKVEAAVGKEFKFRKF
jgi:hypothetical protein